MIEREPEGAPQSCGFCDGRGTTWKWDRQGQSSGNDQGACPACFGRGSVLVAQPAEECTACHGWGRVGAGLESTAGRFDVCDECGGMGWQNAMPIL